MYTFVFVYYQVFVGGIKPTTVYLCNQIWKLLSCSTIEGAADESCLAFTQKKKKTERYFAEETEAAAAPATEEKPVCPNMCLYLMRCITVWNLPINAVLERQAVKLSNTLFQNLILHAMFCYRRRRRRRRLSEAC